MDNQDYWRVFFCLFLKNKDGEEKQRIFGDAVEHEYLHIKPGVANINDRLFNYLMLYVNFN